MLSVFLLLLLLIPPSCQFLFGSLGGGGSSCSCPCPARAPAPIPICAPAPICAQPAPCSSQSSYNYNYNSYSPQPSPYYQPGWMPAIPAAAPASYSTSYASAPAPLLIPSSPAYVAPIPAASYSAAPPILPPLVGPIPPSPYYESPQFVSTLGYVDTTPLPPAPSYLQSGYVPAPNNYAKTSYESITSMESIDEVIPPPPPPPPLPPLDPNYEMREVAITPSTYIYSTSEVLQPTGYSPGYVPNIIPVTSGYTTDLEEDGLVEKQGYWPKASGESTKYDQLDKRHTILKRMKVEAANATSITRTNTTCNSIKLANVMMKSIIDDVSVSKRMIQHATKLAFDGSKFDVFCASGEFSYSIHSRKYCEVSKDDITCFAFR